MARKKSTEKQDKTREHTEANDKMLKVLRSLIEFEAGDYQSVREAVQNRNELRRELKGMLEARAELPENSELYAGLKATTGRVRWRGVAEALQERLQQKGGMTIQEYELFLKDYRKPGAGLKYGSIKDDAKKLSQTEFAFVTPRSLS